LCGAHTKSQDIKIILSATLGSDREAGHTSPPLRGRCIYHCTSDEPSRRHLDLWGERFVALTRPGFVCRTHPQHRRAKRRACMAVQRPYGPSRSVSGRGLGYVPGRLRLGAGLSASYTEAAVLTGGLTGRCPSTRFHLGLCPEDRPL
jgi:hypothetical protein